MLSQRTDTKNYTMNGAREVLATTAARLEQQITSIESALINNPSLVFDLAKTLIETACKTILTDRAQQIDENWDLPRLLKEATTYLRLSSDQTTDGYNSSESLRKILGGLLMAIHGICEMRNSEGFASHGKDGYAQQSEQLHAHFVARAADVIVYFLFSTHRQFPASAEIRRLIYEELSDFNDWLDGQQDTIVLFNKKLKPSELLFQLDIDEYRFQLSDYEQQLNESASMHEEESIQ